MKKLKKVKAPINGDGITQGKIYDVVSSWENNITEFNFTIKDLERYVSEATITDTLPSYIAIDENGNEVERIAVFEQDLNPTWVLSDNNVLTQNVTFAKTLQPGASIKPLYLKFPGLKAGYNVVNSAQIELVPDKIGNNESNLIVSDDISIYNPRYAPIKYKGDPRFDKEDYKQPWFDGNTSYFYDMQTDREKIIPYFLRVSSLASVTVEVSYWF